MGRIWESINASNQHMLTHVPNGQIAGSPLCKLYGHLVSVNVQPESHSYISTLCARHLGPPIVAGAFNGAVSVKI